MSRRKMATQHAANPAAFDASDPVVLNGSLSGNRRNPFGSRFYCRFAELSQCVVHGGDQAGQLI
jgi:hypothetical protein